MAQLDSFLVEQKRLGRRVLLIIDEAQTFSENTLEQVRLLSNLETSREKLIQILLLGQPELDRKLDGQGLRQLRQRISVRWKLEPLSAEETRAYVRHRIEIAAGKPKELFSEAALRQIHRRTSGIPRLINQLCDRALLAGYVARKSQIQPSLIRAAAREIPDARLGRGRGSEREIGRGRGTRPWFFAAASLAVVMVATFAGLQVGRHGLLNASQSLFSLGSGESRTETMRRLAGAEPDGSPPQVGANAPSRTYGAPREDGSAPGPGATGERVLATHPPLARMIGYMPSASGDSSQSEPESYVNGAPNPSSEASTFVSSAVALPIPAPPRPEVTALAPGLLPSLLRNRDGQIAMAESQRAVLEGFGRRVPLLTSAPTNRSTLQSGIEERGLAATPFDGGSIDLLRRLDHPVLISLAVASPSKSGRVSGARSANETPPADARWLAIVGFTGDRARLAGLISNRIVTVPIDELTDHWLETGIIVWERFEPVPDLLFLGEEGQGVLWLQRSLAELRLFSGQASGLFEDDTRIALVRFQKRNGLVADGIAGPLTQIALYGKLSRYPVPRLSSVSTSPRSLSASSSSFESRSPNVNSLGSPRQETLSAPSTPSARRPGEGNPSTPQTSQGSGTRG